MPISDKEIRKLCVGNSVPIQGPLLDPFSESVDRDSIISYGLTSSGYDIRLGYDFLVYKNSFGEAIDPKRMKDSEYFSRMFDKIHTNMPVTIPSNGYVLGGSVERFIIPRYIKGTCTGKSTYARSGIIINVTPLENGWEGYLTIEISNASPCPALVYPGEGIAQIEFHLTDGEVEKCYRDKKGKYQNQKPLTPSIVR